MHNEKPMVVFIEGKKVNLRPFARDDIPLLTRWINNPSLREFLAVVLPATEKQETEWFEKIGSDDKNIVLGIETKDGVLIGCMGIHKINWRDRTCTTGAFIGEGENQNKGYGTDAKMFLLDYIFNMLNLRKVCSEVIAYNTRSLQYSLHCGYVQEGMRRAHVFRKGEYHDLIELGLFKEEWLPIWKRYQETGKIPKLPEDS